MSTTQELTQAVQEHSRWIAPLQAELGRVVVGQKYLVDRLLIGLLANGHILLEGVPGLAKTLTVKTLAAMHPDRLFAHPVHARPAPGGPRRHARLQPEDRRFHHQAGAALFQPDPRRRGQPRPGQGPERAARSDAGAAGHHRRDDLQTARPVPRARHAKPARPGGHLPASRGAVGPLHVEAQHHLSHARRGAADPRPDGHQRAEARRGGDRQPGRHPRGAGRGQHRLHRRPGEGLHRGRGARHARSGGRSPARGSKA